MIETAGNLRIVNELGHGGMGVVYLAEHMHLNKKFAVKSLSVKYTDDSNFRQRFYQEANNQALLDHPNIVQVTDFFEEQGQYFLVMEYVEGEDLGELIRREGRLGEEKALSIMKSILAGLGFAHRKGMIHRDIKPGNIMVGKDGRVRATDFGLAVLAGEKRLTMDGDEKALTPWYASPEQITRPKEIDHRSDVYSLGIVFFEMLTGQVPFDGEPYSVVHLQVNEPLPDPTKMNPEIKPELASIVAKCVAKNPDKRFQGCDEFLKAILDYENRANETNKTSRKLLAISSVAIASIILLLIITKGFFTNKPEPVNDQYQVAALVQNGVSESSLLCKSLQRLPIAMNNLKIARESLNNAEIESVWAKNVSSIRNDIESGAGRLSETFRKLREFSDDSVQKEIKNLIESEQDSNKTKFTTQVFSYYTVINGEMDINDFGSNVCSR